MRRVHIVGRKNHGKTTLILELISELARRGLRAGTIKHTSHVHDLDSPGTDTYRQRAEGADPAVFVTADAIGVFMARPSNIDFYERLAPLFSDCHLVLVEGHLDSKAVKIEVWREAAEGMCLAWGRDDIVAVVTDDPLDISLPVWPRRDIVALADRISAIV